MELQETAPICLFVYNRADHTRRTVEALKQNALAQESDLVIFSDAPKDESQAEPVQDVRRYIRKIDGFRSVTIIESETNLGLAKSIIEGVTEVVGEHVRVIVLEDDMVTSPYFLTYMNEALEKYAEDDRVISIHGYVYPVQHQLPEAFFLPGADCWGWATWQRGWKLFNADGRHLLAELKRRKLVDSFDFNGAFPFSKMLEEQIKGRNDSWAVRWYASAFLAEKLTLYPGRSLVHNIGNDNSGTHHGDTQEFNSILGQERIDLNDIDVLPSQEGWQIFEEFFRQGRHDYFSRLIHRLRVFFRVIR